MSEIKKSVDESWKENVQQEKVLGEEPVSGVPAEDDSAQTANSGQSEDPGEALELNFLNYVTSLAFQAMIFLGQIPNPMNDNKVDVNLQQAKFLIDTLSLLKEKTKGNLDQQEEELLNSSVYELQMKFVQMSQAENEAPEITS